MDEGWISGLLMGRVLVLTGAGISVASGLQTFRGNKGLYDGLNPYQFASLEGFKLNPVAVWNWYLMRIREGFEAKPNAAHLALKEMEEVARKVTIITSNVDSLHQLAGSQYVYRLHGDILETKCMGCGDVEDLEMEVAKSEVTADTLPRCGCGGLLRPNVVWFGEYPWQEALEAVREELPNADLVLEVGVSGQVSYGFSQIAAEGGIPVVRINPDGEPEHGIHLLRDVAEAALPRLVHKAKAFASLV